MGFSFSKRTNWVDMPKPTNSDYVGPSHCLANKNSSMGVMLSNISRAAVGVPGKADKIIRQASLCTFVSFLTRYFLLRPPAQDTRGYNMIGRIIAVYIHFIIDGFISYVLLTIFLYCINTVVALPVIQVICGFQVSLLSTVTPNSLAFLESLSFVPFIDK